MTPRNLHKFFLFLSCILFFSLNIQAQPSPEMIYLEADSVKYDYKKGIIIYKGNVHGKQGLTALDADQMIVYYNQTHQIRQVDALGDTAHYRTLLKKDNNLLLHASAKKISYYPLLSKVLLIDNANLKYGNNEFSGPYIVYDMEHEIITSHPNKNNKSKIILEPIKNITQLNHH